VGIQQFGLFVVALGNASLCVRCLAMDVTESCFLTPRHNILSYSNFFLFIHSFVAVLAFSSSPVNSAFLALKIFLAILEFLAFLTLLGYFSNSGILSCCVHSVCCDK
jgi:hypothetical protein